MHATEYAQELIRFDSVSSRSNVAVTDHLSNRLASLGFAIERTDYVDEHGVAKACVAAKRGSGLGGIAYFGHTDVVPADDWSFAGGGAFEPTLHEDRLYGRGACDMKGSVACALAAAERLRDESFDRPLYLVCTADEEIGYEGAKRVVEQSAFLSRNGRRQRHGNHRRADRTASGSRA